MTRILIADPDPYIVSLAMMYLERHGHVVVWANSPGDVARMVEEDPPEIFIFGLSPRAPEALETIRRLRGDGRPAAVMILVDPDETEEAFPMAWRDLVDDRLTKPFHGRELLARVERMGGRGEVAPSASRALDDEILTLGDVSVDLVGRTVTVAGSAVSLRAMEFELLSHLLQRPGRVCSREDLFEAVWGLSGLGESRTVDVHMSQVRRRLAGSGSVQIETIWGRGYKLTLRGEP